MRVRQLFNDAIYPFTGLVEVFFQQAFFRRVNFGHAGRKYDCREAVFVEVVGIAAGA